MVRFVFVSFFVNVIILFLKCFGFCFWENIMDMVVLMNVWESRQLRVKINWLFFLFFAVSWHVRIFALGNRNDAQKMNLKMSSKTNSKMLKNTAFIVLSAYTSVEIYIAETVLKLQFVHNSLGFYWNGLHLGFGHL